MLTPQIFENIQLEIKVILEKALYSEEITPKEALSLLNVTGNELIALQYVANHLCQDKHNNNVSFVVNRNINFTNICYQDCKFCSFHVSNIHEDAFLLSIEEIRNRVIEAKKQGCSEVCMQGGIHPELDYEYYINILKTVKAVDSRIHIHAFSPQEVFRISKLKNDTIENTLKALRDAGLDSMPGTAAEILVDEIRDIICPNKVSVAQWREIVSTAHKLGISTTATIMYGHIEDLSDRVKHLEVIREIQKETNGFTEFVPLVFIKENPILSQLKDHPLKPNYGIDDLRLYAVSRIFFHNLIDNIQCSWVKLGTKLAQISLDYGVNDFSGTLMEENISKSAGADYGEFLSAEEIINIIKAAGKKPVQRDTVYNIIKYY